MSLTRYKQKRSFKSTPEPTGGANKKSELHFVIQKHDATRLHYDFRLEMDGVLKSWAVPKGPSTDPSVKRLAMMVEDHPYDYRNFEGIIPEGNYGAGTVMVWDEGSYEPIDDISGKKEQEKALLKQLKQGSLKVQLHGKKLKGEFALVRLKNSEDNAWLLIKHNDQYAKKADVTNKDKSVVSGKTLKKIAAAPEKIYGEKTAAKPASKIKKATPRKRAAKKAVSKKSSETTSAKVDLSDAVHAAFPKTVKPMLATLVDKPFDEAGWLCEIKWDGYRAVSLCNKEKVEIISRNNKPFTEKFYPVHTALKQLNLHAILDGEVVVLNEAGRSQFGSLQNWRSEADGELVYYVFDILWLDGYNLEALPLTRRREILKSILPEEGTIRMSETFDAPATQFLSAAAANGLEGIIMKKADSLYQEGERVKDWLKVKAMKRHEVVIGGFTQNEGTSKSFSSLLVGVYTNGRLHYTGKIGTGFNDKQQKEMMAAFKPLITTKVPFTEEPDVNKPSRFRPNPPHATVTWLKPQLVCEVSYTEITTDGVMRHPSFEGMREDKKAKDVAMEKATPVEKITKHAVKKAATKKAKPGVQQLLKPSATGRKSLVNPSEKMQVKEVSGHELTFTNVNKIYWPKEKYTKGDMLNYYYQAAPYILPYLKNMPQTLNRLPNGIIVPSLYQNDITGKAPSWIKKFPYHTGDGKDKNFLVVEDEASLLYMANLGAIEMNPWSSTIEAPDNPDWSIIDIDPSDKNTFDQAIETAQVTKQVLDSIKVKGYCKTSGSTGIHIYIPLQAKYSYEESQLFARWIATQVQHELPGFTSIERMTDKRKGKIYVDFLQNRPGATLAAPYSVRPKPGASVSMPLHWDEVKKGLKVKDFTIKNAIERVKSEGDLFKPVLGKGIALEKIIKKINATTE